MVSIRPQGTGASHFSEKRATNSYFCSPALFLKNTGETLLAKKTKQTNKKKTGFTPTIFYGSGLRRTAKFT